MQQTGYGTAASRWAGVGPYYAMFPTSFATAAVREYTKQGDSIFDPFAGRSTALFAAATEGRYGFGIEISPVGWVYGKAKLQTAKRADVEDQIRWLGSRAADYRREAMALPEFYHYCYCPSVIEFLLAARDLLHWRRSKTDWTTMAFLLIDLHGKRQSALSNQMRQTKSLSPQYAVEWWKERDMKPPSRDPVEFMLSKVEWRYAKGHLDSGLGRVYLGDSQSILTRWAGRPMMNRAALLLTSPPYFGVTNYFYDQWLRLWLLGGTATPLSTGDPSRRKFENKEHYLQMLRRIFALSRGVLKRDAVVYVRTDSRQFTRNATIDALEHAFPHKRIRVKRYSVPKTNQTALFDTALEARGEIDLVMW